MGTNGTPIEQWTCDKISNELWTIGVGQTTANQQLVSDVSPYHKDKCISTSGLANGDAMVLYAGTPATTSGKWSLTTI